MGVIELENLTKDYGDIRANDAVSFNVDEGEVFGYLGPNGAGKTTTIRLLLGLIKPTSGKGSVLGADITDRRALTAVKHKIGYLPDSLGFDDGLTGRETLDYFAGMRADKRRDDLLELFTPPLDQAVETYSAGNRRMLGIIQAFMHDPELVIMDEPTAGLDPLKQDRLHEFIDAEKEAGKTIFFSSHILSEAQRVCDRVGIIRDGAIVALEDIEQLLTQSGKEVWVHFDETVDESAFLSGDMIDVTTTEHTVQFTYTGQSKELLERLVQFDITDLHIGDPQLDTIFKHYYRKENDS